MKLTKTPPCSSGAYIEDALSGTAVYYDNGLGQAPWGIKEDNFQDCERTGFDYGRYGGPLIHHL